MPKKIVNPLINDTRLMQEWDWEKNGKENIFPDKIGIGSNKKVWWKCKKGHEWQASVSNRARLGRNCPYCARRLPVVGETDLETTNPELAKEWHPIKNGNITPKNFTNGSHKKVWWICNKGHEWIAEIKSRTCGVGCPVCANKVVSVGENDLASVNPELAKEWHPTKNGNLTPQQFTFGSGKKVWWLCKNGHEFLKSIDARRRSPNCPICLSRRRTSFPEQAIFFYVKQVFPDAINSYKEIFDKKSNMELDIYIPSIKVAIEFDGRAYHAHTENRIRDQKKYFICKLNHIILIRISDTLIDSLNIRYDYKIEIPDTSPKWLDYAIGYLLYKLGKSLPVNVNRDRQKILSYLTSMDKSLLNEYPQIAEEWNYEKNASLKPEMMHPESNEKVWWKCKICGFEWKTSIVERTGPDKTGCPKCAVIKGAQKHHQFALKQKGSIAQIHPELLEEWDYSKNTVLPEDLTAGSGEKVWWKCKKCGYSWRAAVHHRTTRGSGCPCCLNKVIVKGFNDLATTHPNLLKDWDYNKNLLKPDEIPAGTGKKIFWKCNVCGFEWEAVCTSRARGAGCPHCAKQKKRKNVTTLKHKD